MRPAALLIVAGALLLAFQRGPAEERPRARSDSWRQDLRFFVSQLRAHHRNPFHLVTEKDFDEAVTAFDTQIPRLNDDEVVVGLERLAAMVGDGHTLSPGAAW